METKLDDSDIRINGTKTLMVNKRSTYLLVTSFVDHGKGSMAQHVASVVLELTDSLHREMNR